MRLTITRHGQTVENTQGILQGQTHGRLSTLGKEQAKLLAKRLSKEHFDIIYASDLRRVKQTVSPLLKYHPKTKLIYTKTLRERSFGPLEGMCSRNIDFEHEELHGALSGKTNGETKEQFYNGIKKFLTEIRSKHHGKSVLVIAHGGVKVAFMAILNRIPIKDLQEYKEGSPYRNTSVTVVSFTKKSHKILFLGCTKHLQA